MISLEPSEPVSQLILIFWEQLRAKVEVVFVMARTKECTHLFSCLDQVTPYLPRYYSMGA